MLRAVECIILLCVAAPGALAVDWPAESFDSATDITVSGMDADVSGAVWSPVDSSLWVVRQNRQVWKMQQCGGTFCVSGHWTSLPTGGDLEAITRIVPADPDAFCVLHEDTGTAYHISVSSGSPSLVRSWQLTAGGDMPGELSGYGPEGMAFVPDEWLTGFVDGAGQARTSANGMGGLLFVGHQVDGHIYVFDLDPDHSNAFDFVGEYVTSRDEVAALEFDATNGLLYIFHNAKGSTWNETEITDLTSAVVAGGRKFTTIQVYAAPPGAGGNNNMEGIALSHSHECDTAYYRHLFVTLDGGGGESLKWFAEYPCDCNANGIDDAEDVVVGAATNCNANGSLDECELIAGYDLDADDDVDLDDLAAFVDCSAGPNALPEPADAACAGWCLSGCDRDQDGDVDLCDFAGFQAAFAGSSPK